MDTMEQPLQPYLIQCKSYHLFHIDIRRQPWMICQLKTVLWKIKYLCFCHFLYVFFCAHQIVSSLSVQQTNSPHLSPATHYLPPPHFDYSRQCIPDKNHNGAFKYKIDRWSFIVSCSPTFFIITANKDIIHRNVGTCCRSPPAFCRNPVQKPIRQQTTALAHLINSSIMLH